MCPIQQVSNVWYRMVQRILSSGNPQFKFGLSLCFILAQGSGLFTQSKMSTHGKWSGSSGNYIIHDHSLVKSSHSFRLGHSFEEKISSPLDKHLLTKASIPHFMLKVNELTCTNSKLCISVSRIPC